MYTHTKLRLPYPTVITINDMMKVTGSITSLIDDGEGRTLKVLLDNGQEMVYTSKSSGTLVDTYIDDDGITWCETVDNPE